jgi:hypothetical protein
MEPADPGRSRVTAIGIAVLALLTGLSLLYPILRLLVLLPIDGNEGWNAQLAMRAMGAGPLYPPPESFFYNNYPPLSFYVVGEFGRLMGDNILAGRVVSLVSLLILAANVGAIVRNLGGERPSALTAGLLTLVIFARDFINYVGMDDPQMLAHAVMSAGFVVFTAAPARLRNLALAACLMALAGFIKHNIIAMPLAVTTWLYCHDRRTFWRWLRFCLGLLAAGLALCAGLYGRDFFTQLMLPREYSFLNILIDLGRMQAYVVPLVVWILFAVQFRSDRRVALINHLIAAGALAYGLNRLGDGVAENSLFDMAIGCCIGLGVALSRSAEGAFSKRHGDAKARALIFAALCLRAVTPPQSDLLHLSSRLEELHAQAAALAPDIAFARTKLGPAICANQAFCYWSGHLSDYAWGMRKLESLRDYSILDRRIRQGEFAFVQAWSDRQWPAVTQAEPPLQERWLSQGNGVLFYR